jgi:hypothetical protein
VQLEFRAEKQHSGIVQLEEAIPFENAGTPKGDREAEAQHQLRERRLGNHLSDGSQPMDEPADRLQCAATGDSPFKTHRCPSPKRP